MLPSKGRKPQAPITPFFTRALFRFLWNIRMLNIRYAARRVSKWPSRYNHFADVGFILDKFIIYKLLCKRFFSLAPLAMLWHDRPGKRAYVATKLRGWRLRLFSLVTLCSGNVTSKRISPHTFVCFCFSPPPTTEMTTQKAYVRNTFFIHSSLSENLTKCD